MVQGLSWQSIDWHAHVDGGEQQKLHGLTGHIANGQVMAIMGPSGSGKTTLLDILAMRKTSGRIGGGVRVDGWDRCPGFFQRASAYIPHEDAFLPTLTVFESLQYHAQMRMPRWSTKEQKQDRIGEVLRLVGLRKALHTMVGGVLPGGLSLRGLSGGEKKRQYCSGNAARANVSICR